MRQSMAGLDKAGVRCLPARRSVGSSTTRLPPPRARLGTFASHPSEMEA